jgi:predicted enzyme related to lactoylglutathione lyase
MAPKLVSGQVAYIEIPAVDIQRSADFYVKVFGWRISKREDGSSAFEDTGACCAVPG